MIQLERHARRRLPWRDLLSLGLLAAVLVAGGLLVNGCGGKAGGEAGAHDHSQQYHCPMHPTYISDRPGDCPICGMRLVPISRRPAGAIPPCPRPCRNRRRPEDSGRERPRRIVYYRNPMDPTITSPVPTKDGMGMDYVPVYADEVAAPAGSCRAWRRSSSTPRDCGSLACRPRRRCADGRPQRPHGRHRRADETRVRHVHTKIAGWVEKLYVNFTGQLVRAGEPLLSIYSPRAAGQPGGVPARARGRGPLRRAPSCPRSARAARSCSPPRAAGSSCSTCPRLHRRSSSAAASRSATVTLLAPVSGFVTAKDDRSRASRSSPAWSCSPSPTSRGSGSRPTSTSTRPRSLQARAAGAR